MIIEEEMKETAKAAKVGCQAKKRKKKFFTSLHFHLVELKNLCKKDFFSNY